MWLLYFISRFKWPQNKLYLLFFYWCPKTLWLGNLEKQGFIWYYSSRGINIHQREEESLVAVLAAGVISYKITFWTARMRQREQTGNCPWLLKPPHLFFSDIFPPEKPQILNLPKQHYLLWTKYLNAWDYGSISFKTSQKPPMLTQNLDTFFSFIELTRYEETENFRVHYRNWQPVLWVASPWYNSLNFHLVPGKRKILKTWRAHDQSSL